MAKLLSTIMWQISAAKDPNFCHQPALLGIGGGKEHGSFYHSAARDIVRETLMRIGENASGDG